MLDPIDPNVTDRQTIDVRNYERTNHSTRNWHRHPLRAGFLYTDGIKFVADICDAYWLIQLVVSYQSSITQKLEEHGLRPFQVWRIKMINGDWTVDAWSDTPEKQADDDGPASVLLARQVIGLSDFPEGLSGFEFWVEGSTALLKCEH